MPTPSKLRREATASAEVDDSQKQMFVEKLKSILSPLAKEEADRNYGGDPSKIPEAKKRELLDKAKLLAIDEYRNDQEQKKSGDEHPIKSETTSYELSEPQPHDDPVTVAQRQAELYTTLPSPPDDCKFQVQIWQNKLTEGIIKLNRLHVEFKVVSESASLYPFQQKIVLDHMARILSIRSGLADLVQALLSPDKLVELYNASKIAAAKIEKLLPDIKQVVTCSLALITDATTKHTMISQTYTTFYNQFSALKARLVVEDIGRGMTQDKFGDVLKQSRLEVWRALEPNGDEELHQGMEKWNSITTPAEYGSGYAVGTGGVFPPSFVGEQVEHNI